jgi:hypothetical protein
MGTMRTANLAFSSKEYSDRNGWGCVVNSKKRVEVLSSSARASYVANVAYPRKRGAGVNAFVLQAGEPIHSTPFATLLAMITNIGIDGIRCSTRLSSMPNSPIRSVGELERICSTVLRLLNDRIALSWRKTGEEDVLGTFQNGLLLSNEVFLTMQALSTLHTQVTDRLKVLMSTSKHVHVNFRLLCLFATKLQHHLKWSLPTMQTRVDYYMHMTVSKLAHTIASQAIKPGSFVNCKVHASKQTAAERSRSKSALSCTSRNSVRDSIIMTKQSGSNKSLVNDSSKILDEAMTAESSPLKNKPNFVHVEPGDNSNSMDSQGLTILPLTQVRIGVLRPLHAASKTHCEHPVSMQMLSLCINVALEEFLSCLLAEVTASGIDATGVRSIFEQMQDLRSWVISVKEEMGLQVLLQDINSWLRVDEILTILCSDINTFWDLNNAANQFMNQSNGSISAEIVNTNNHNNSSVHSNNNSSSLRRYDNGSIESRTSVNRKSGQGMTVGNANGVNNSASIRSGRVGPHNNNGTNNNVASTKSASKELRYVNNSVGMRMVRVICAPALCVLGPYMGYKPSAVVPLPSVDTNGVHAMSRLNSNSSINVSISSTGAATVAAGISAITRSQQLDNLITGRVLLTDDRYAFNTNTGGGAGGNPGSARNTMVNSRSHSGAPPGSPSGRSIHSSRGGAGGVEGIDAAAGLSALFSSVPALSTTHSRSVYRDDVFWDGIIFHFSRKVLSLVKNSSSLSEKEKKSWEARAIRMQSNNISLSKKFVRLVCTGRWGAHVQMDIITELQKMKIETSDM